jgi:hypothetical protein
VCASDFSPNGRYFAGTIGIDDGSLELKVVLIEFATPLSATR